MPGEVVKHAEALEDLEAQAVFLVESGGTKLAGGFLDAAESAFAGLARMPHIGAPHLVWI